MFRAPSEPQEASWASISETYSSAQPASAYSPERSAWISTDTLLPAIFCIALGNAVPLTSAASGLGYKVSPSFSSAAAFVEPPASPGHLCTKLEKGQPLHQMHQNCKGQKVHAALNMLGSNTDNKVWLCGCKKERKVPGNKNTSRTIPKDYGQS